MKRFWLRFVICSAVVILAILGFEFWINVPPKVDIAAPPQIPHPNGYEYFVKAGNAFVEDKKGVDKTTDSHWKEGKKYPLEPKEAWLKENAQALHLLREGLKYPAINHLTEQGQFEEYSKFRGLARALAVEIHVDIERGEFDKAAHCALDGLQFGYAVERGGSVIAGLVGKAIEAIILREMYEISPHLSAVDAKKTAKQMEYFYINRQHYFQTLQEEKRRGQISNLELMQQKKWRLQLVNSLVNPPYLQFFGEPLSRSAIVKGYWKYSRIFIMRKSTFMDNYAATLDAAIANGRVPYKDMRPLPTFKDSLMNLLMPAYENSRWNWGRMDTYYILNMTMLALRAYKLEHGNYPDNLHQLVPTYLQKIPLDPFDETAPLRYKLRKEMYLSWSVERDSVKPLHRKLQEEKYFLWSIGPDGIDNNCAPIVNEDISGNNPNGARYRLLDPDSKGDVVAGINVP